MVTNRTRNADGEWVDGEWVDGEWVDGEPTAHNVRVYGTAASNLYDSAGRGGRVIVHGLMKIETWTDRDTQHKRTKQVVEVSNRFGEVGGSFRFDAARVERQRPTPSSASSSIMPSSADEKPAAVEPAAG